MSTATTQLMTADEFLRRHGDDRWVELVDGRVERIPMPGIKHGQVCITAGAMVLWHAKAHKLGRVAGNDSFVRTRTDPDGVRGADVLYVSYDRLPADVPVPVGAITPPIELVIEVRSPSNTLAGLTKKAGEYLEAGVEVVVVLDPDLEAAAVYRANELPQRFHNGDEFTLPDILPGFAVPVKAFFE